MKKPKQIIGLASHGGSAIKYMIENDPHYGIDYVFAGCIVNYADAGIIEYLKTKNIPCHLVSIKEFLANRGVRKIQDMSEVDRIDYSNLVGRIITDVYMDADLVLMSGWNVLFKGAIIDYFWKLIINVHPAKLSILNPDNTRKYIGRGDKVIEQIYKDKLETTCSTIHYVDDTEDGGEIICESDPMKIDYNILPKQHQELQKTTCDGPAMIKAVHILFGIRELMVEDSNNGFNKINGI